ncbi:MAG: thiamine pyrophosphate-binding protein [Planctomycetes bacterium]|nr:thiamine pyrophosphate-binding protein [Planctomycetota bacterium]
MTGGDILIDELRARGVKFIATLNGHGLDPIYLACRKVGMRMIDVRNEQAASYMAEVTGRLTRSVGVCAVSGAVAHVNALSGVLNAWFDGAPMLLVTGITPLAELGWGNFQDFNPVPVAEPICKYARLVDTPHRVGQFVHEAFAAATSGRPGPVHLAMPLDVSAAEVAVSDAIRSKVQSGDVRISGGGDAVLIAEAAKLLRTAQRPVLVIGSGLYYARGEAALAEFLNQQRIPTVLPIWDRGSVPGPQEAFLGVIGAASGGPRILEEADVIVLAGAEFDYRVGQISPPRLAPDAKVVRIHADSSRLRNGLEADLSIAGSPATVLEQLAEECRRLHCPPAEVWLAEARRRRDQFRKQCLDTAQRLRPGLNGCDVVQAIQQVLTDETIWLVDGGNIGQWFHQLLPDRCPGHWVTCGASGVVGWGLPGAIAARAIYPDRPVILLSGDGSFTFTVAELECAARQGLPFVAVVADDQRWGITASGHTKRYGEPLYSTLGPTRLDRVAEGFGCVGVRVERQEELVPALREALTSDRPTVVHVPIVPGGPSD